MRMIDAQQTISEIITRVPNLSRFFESLGIDCGCGGNQILAEACQQNGLDLEAVLGRLKEVDRAGARHGIPSEVTTMSLTELVDHIENTHHAYLHVELPRLARLTREVGSLHSGRDPRLKQLQEIYRAMALELWCHMFKEEHCLFPKIRQLETTDEPTARCSSLSGPICQMESEHDHAQTGLNKLQELTDGFVTPVWACDAHSELLSGLAYLETDMQVHIHKENDVLFPRALELEAQRQLAALYPQG